MLQNKEWNQAEELSECLDDFNDGRHPITQDEEIKELVELANLVKQSYNQGDVPEVLIGGLVDHLAAELKVQKRQKRRTHWMYGGLIGTAVAILIAAFVQFLLPQSADHHIAQQIDDSMATQRSVAAIDQASVPIIPQTTNAIIEQQDQSDSSTETTAAQSVEKKTANDLSKVITEIIQVAESPQIEQKPNQVAMLQKEYLLQQKTPKDMMRTKSVLISETDINSLGEDKNSQLERRIAIMVLPNQRPQSITVDNTSGVIRQVYHQGTNDEIIITQRLLDESMIKAGDDAKQGEGQGVVESIATQPIHKETKNSMNSLTVKVDKYSITIEGKKTKEELQKIVRSLTEMK